VRFAKGGARVTGVDLAQTAVDLARRNFGPRRRRRELRVADGEVAFASEFRCGLRSRRDQYTADPQLIRNATACAPDAAIFMVYNRVSWLNGCQS
jgi:hypothetical protein